jgi:hypothetical protein
LVGLGGIRVRVVGRGMVVGEGGVGEGGGDEDQLRKR